MADIKSGEPFGMESSYLAKIDWDLARRRITQDSRSDFIYAPHLNFIYSKAGVELETALVAELKAGNYSPGLPLTIEVPKSFRIRVAAQIKRLGPNYSRPGSILLPRDRMLYQALADQAAPIIKTKTNPSRSFSHKLAASDSASMFMPTRTCWSELQSALRKYSKDEELRYILKVDVANYFGSLNQHILINVLSDSGFPKALHSRLEAILTSFTGERSSRGILQGMYPSDLFGNFYLAPVDKILRELGVPSARYVDDIYIFVRTMNGAERLLRELIPALRSYDLVLNEAKSVVMPKSSLMTEEPDLESLFADAVSEIASQVDDEDFDADYGFQSDWDEAEVAEDDDDLELKATKGLFDSIEAYPGHEENIERFCLPLFSKAGSDYAVASVLDAFEKRPAMSQIYASYLAKFLDNNEVREFLLELLANRSLVDWQKLWILAALSQVSEADDSSVKVAMGILKDGDRHETLRAVAAIYVGRFGDHQRRKALVSYYGSVSPYIQAAIYFSTRGWPGMERSNAKASWGSQNQLNVLLTAGMANK
ncbi:RNA-directed DNA polymerase [Bradyrhizobium sp. 76]|uniref:RNA-directed DNA polymerase n=1 Tax=Bradyrhizobium sp. 76 TaxID=2782680 RepID=UPI001FFC04AE|nr:RNA-directed DNA polymerase [Bradyrhizobium sp. 76]MCK1409529.1 RNA-directed DNA polymerase [Bradyrhizobium sp. 76]